MQNSEKIITFNSLRVRGESLATIRKQLGMSRKDIVELEKLYSTTIVKKIIIGNNSKSSQYTAEARKTHHQSFSITKSIQQNT